MWTKNLLSTQDLTTLWCSLTLKKKIPKFFDISMLALSSHSVTEKRANLVKKC